MGPRWKDQIMPYAVTVVFDIKPGHMDAFMPHILQNARSSVRDEPGCRQFDVCTDPALPDTVFLYELYDDLAAFEAHQGMPHYIACGLKIGDLVAGKTLKTYAQVDR
ncbi:putative quinol monooxygenase [uncultured Tateyamaria sp.]|uniref:putative quinol monooxygenase n=1 Tax=uncultured Tateyamaria sp. TaxID=455651 RepID=UPI002631F24C|nr:putative quinol monooxygenase [uncultured Tateyamaria sp.]